MTTKKQLHQACVRYAEAQLQNIKNAMAALQDTLGDTSKSSAGDKHETGRAMAQLEQERLSAQLAENKKLFDILHKIDPEKPCQKPCLGALVYSNNGTFYLSIGVGKITIQQKDFYAIAQQAPLTQAILQSNGNSFTFNNKVFEIIGIE